MSINKVITPMTELSDPPSYVNVKGTVYFMEWSLGLESWIGAMEWSIGVDPRSRNLA